MGSCRTLEPSTLKDASVASSWAFSLRLRRRASRAAAAMAMDAKPPIVPPIVPPTMAPVLLGLLSPSSASALTLVATLGALEDTIVSGSAVVRLELVVVLAVRITVLEAGTI